MSSLKFLCIQVGRLRKLVLPINCAGAFQNQIRKKSTKTPVLSRAPEQSPADDILFEQLSKANNTGRVFELVSMHHDIMNNNHISVTLKTLHEMQSSHNLTYKDLQCNPAFHSLCKRAMRRARFFDSNEALTCFKAFTFLKVPIETTVMQTFLQMIRHHINDLNLSQIIFLNFLLSKHKNSSTPLSNSLNIAIPLIFKAQFDLQLDADNIAEVVKCLSFASFNHLTFCYKRLITILLEKHNLLTTEQSISVAAAIIHIPSDVEGSSELFHHLVDHIKVNIDLFEPKQLLPIVIGMSHSRITNAKFLEAVVNKALSDSWDFKFMYTLITSCFYCYVPLPQIVNYLVTNIENIKDIVVNDNRISILNLAGNISLCGGSSEGNKVFDVLSNCDKKIQNFKEQQPWYFIKFISKLTSCGYYPLHLLPQLWNEGFLLDTYRESLNSGREKNVLDDMCYIHWALKIEASNYCGESIPQDLIMKAIRSDAVSISSNVDASNTAFSMEADGPPSEKDMYDLAPVSLGKFLRAGIGGSQFVKSNVWTKYGHFINHVIVTRRGNFPVAINEETEIESNGRISLKFIEDIFVPSDAVVVALIVGTQTAYCNYPRIPTDITRLKLRTLRKLGYCPLLIDGKSWMSLFDNEKTPFIMREINHFVDQHIKSLKEEISPCI